MRTMWVILLATLAIASSGCFRSSNGGDSGTSSQSTVANGEVTQAGDSAAGTRASDAQRTYPLDSLPTSTVTINEHVFNVWLAREFDDNGYGVVTEGLMHVPEGEIDDDQGMLFVFSDERQHRFWMRNTITPLDIAFARSNGTIVKIWQMPPLTLRTFPSVEPAMFALEVKQGTFESLGIKEGDQMQFADDIFTAQP